MPLQMIDWALNIAIPHGGEIFTAGKKEKSGACRDWNNTRHIQQHGGRNHTNSNYSYRAPSPAIIRIIKVLQLNAQSALYGSG